MGRYLRITEVMSEVGLRRATIYKLMAKGTFPKQISLGGKCVAWAESEIKAWKNEKMSNRDAKAA